ncbi:MAG TPA: M1 family peptidase, partial [Bacteroidia bacterium]|nr:M1 family peptidase [Bacteroidia bacterium]
MKNYFYIFFLLPLSFFSQNYWQQRVNYTINVKLNDQKHELSGFENVEYHNNSESTLTFIYFHLWPNAYKDNTTALAKQFLSQGSRSFYFAPESDRGYIDSLHFKAGDEVLRTEIDKDNPDICKVYLPKPLLPGDKVNISTP